VTNFLAFQIKYYILYPFVSGSFPVTPNGDKLLGFTSLESFPGWINEIPALVLKRTLFECLKFLPQLWVFQLSTALLPQNNQ
jgi:hypothetical protein